MNINVKTYECNTCDYTWQFSGEAANTTPYDLSAWQLEQQFPEPQFKGLQAGKCPSCYARGVVGILGLVIDPDKMSTISVSSDDDIEQREVEELDEHGNPIMIDSGEFTERIGIVNGAIAVIQDPVMIPKMREQTKQEIAGLKAQRDQSLRELEKIAV